MTIRENQWPDATPCWIDLASSDLSAARRFYQELFGWTIEDAAAGYLHCELAGARVCGLTSVTESGQPAGWLSYFAADDPSVTLDRVRQAGGQILVPVGQVGAAGSWAVAADPDGAVFGLWQANEQIGCQRVNEPGSLVWNEHLSRDYQQAQHFYAAAFGWQFQDISAGDFHYATFRAADGRDIGGIGEPPTPVRDLAPRWLVYFAVTDTDATVRLAGQLGGRTILPASSTPHGRLAVLSDGRDGVFAVISQDGGHPAEDEG